MAVLVRLLLRRPIRFPASRKELLQTPLLIVPRSTPNSPSRPLQTVQVICLSEYDDTVTQLWDGTGMVVCVRPGWRESGIARWDSGKGREKGVELVGERRAVGVVDCGARFRRRRR